MSHGESAAAGDAGRPAAPAAGRRLSLRNPADRDALAGDPVGEADAEPGELRTSPAIPMASVGGPAWSDGNSGGTGSTPS